MVDTFEVQYLRVPAVLQRALGAGDASLFGIDNGPRATVAIGAVASVVISRKHTRSVRAEGFRQTFDLDGPALVPSVYLDAGLSWTLDDNQQIAVSVSYEKALTNGFDGLPQDNDHLLSSSFQPDKWQMLGLRASYQF